MTPEAHGTSADRRVPGKDGRPRFGVAVITFNEEENIGPCLDSVHDWADEVVVLDSHSTDRTEEIARSYDKVRFFQHPFDGHVEQKNRALALCEAEWILSIDADERVGPRLRRSIEEFLAEDPPFDGALVPRLTMHSGRFIRHGGWYPHRRYRLIRAGRGRWGGENPHDELRIDGRGARLEGDLLHYSFEDLAEQVETVNQFSSIVALRRFNEGRSFTLWRLLLLPVWKFLEIYLIKRGLLDGMHGFVIAVTSAYSTFLREAKLYELDRLGRRRPSNLGDRYGKRR